MANLIQETGGGRRRVRRPDGRVDEYERSSHWRVRYVVSFPDGSRAMRSKVASQRSQARLNDLMGPAILIQAKPVLPDILNPRSRRHGSTATAYRDVIERRETREQLRGNVRQPKDHEARTIWIPTTTDDPDSRVMAAIRGGLPKKPSGRFIIGGDHTYHRDYISQAVEKVLHQISPDLSTHTLRHTCATWLIGRDVNVVRVRELMGHSDL
jgi:hypothetical protein